MKLTGRRFALGCALLLCAMPAYAYIDPGTGSALIQGVIAAIAAVGVTLKLYWHRIAAFIGRGKKKDSRSASQQMPESQSTHKST